MRTALAAGLAFLALAAPAAAQTPIDTTPTVTADGVGRVALAPDVATVVVYVRERARTSAAARGAANRVVARVARAAAAAGVASADVRTLTVGVSRERVRPRRGRAYIRYQARHVLTLRVREVGKTGALLDAVADAGADSFEGPEYGFADPSQGRLLATRAALADARRRADDAAAQQGLRITGVRSIVLSPDGGGDFETLSAGGGDSGTSGGADQPATLVSPGARQVTERVRVVYTAAPV